MDPYYDPTGAATVLAFVLFLLPILFILIAVGYVLHSFFSMKLFEKAGVQGKWRAWVPVYNSMIQGKLGDFSPWVVLGAIVLSSLLNQVPVLGWLLGLAAYAVMVVYAYRINAKLGKDWPILLLFIIPGLGGLIWLGIVSLDKSRWNPAIPPAPWASTFLADKTVWDGIPVQPSAASAAGGYAQPPAGTPGAAAYPPPAYPPAATYPPAAPPATPPAVPPTAAEPPAPPAEPPAPPTTPPADPTEPPRA